MKRPIIIAFLSLVSMLAFTGPARGEYEAKWESLDKRPTPAWWTDAKFGIFIHWGPYAVPAYAPTPDPDKFDWIAFAEWYQGKMISNDGNFKNHHKTYYGNAPYANFAANFKARFYDPAEWARLFKRAGAKYVVLTSKHHDGYALWPSAESPYFNSVALGSGRDLAGEFCKAMRDAGLRRGFYYSMLEYANAKYPGVRDKKATGYELTIEEWNKTVNLPQLKDLVNRYEPDIIWPDGEWDYPSARHCSEEFLAWLFNSSKVKDDVVVNDRWGKDCRGKHGGHYTSEYGQAEGDAKGDNVMHPWEECRGIGGSFGFNQFETTAHYMSRKKCIETLVGVCARGGNLLLNVGPDADGRIPPIMEDRLLAIGKWLEVNGEAIYATRRAPVKSARKGVYLTAKEKNLYVIDFNLDGGKLEFEGVGEVKSVKLLGKPELAIEFENRDGKLVIAQPALSAGQAPGDYAWAYCVERK